MSIKIGNNDITDVKLGNTQVNSIYLGSTKVWEKAAEYIDLSTIQISLDKGTPASSSGIAGTGWADVNRDSIIVEFQCSHQANPTELQKYWKTASSSSTTRPDIGLFYTIASTTELNYNNVTTGTIAFNLEWLINNFNQSGRVNTITLTRSAGSSSYPYRALSIGTTSGVYYGDKTQGSATAVNLKYEKYFFPETNKFQFVVTDVDHNTILFKVTVKLKEV